MAVTLVSDSPSGPENALANIGRSRAASGTRAPPSRPRLRAGPWQGQLPEGLPPTLPPDDVAVRTWEARWGEALDPRV